MALIQALQLLELPTVANVTAPLDSSQAAANSALPVADVPGTLLSPPLVVASAALASASQHLDATHP